MKKLLKSFLPLKIRIFIRSTINQVKYFFPYHYAKITLKNKYFEFRKKKLNYHIAQYNTTFLNERTVEIPIIIDYINQYKNKKILEIGNVLSHYFNVSHIIVDKYEKGDNLVNSDILDYDSQDKYDLIVSISTFEHIGFDEYNRYGKDETGKGSPDAVLKAIEFTKNLLTSEGLFIFTIPLGFNAFLNSKLKNNELKLTELNYMKRISSSNEWKQVSYDDVEGIRYGYPYICANGILVGIFKNEKI